LHQKVVEVSVGGPHTARMGPTDVDDARFEDDSRFGRGMLYDDVYGLDGELVGPVDLDEVIDRLSRAKDVKRARTGRSRRLNRVSGSDRRRARLPTG
jgi:hypothetical protein